MSRHATRLIGGEEQHATRDVVLVQAELQALMGEELAFHFEADPQRALAWRVDRSRHETVDADVLRSQLARQRAWLKEMAETRRRLFGDKVFPDSSGEFRKMRDERTRQIEDWALPPRRKRKP